MVNGRALSSIFNHYVAQEPLTTIEMDTIEEMYLDYKELKKQLTDISELYHRATDIIADFEESEDRCATLEAENRELKDQIKDLKDRKEIIESNFSYLEAENRKLRERSAELHTIKKSFEVLRALYLGDYEYDPDEE